MIEKIDIGDALNESTLASDAAYIYASATDGSRVKISKANLASVFTAEIGLSTKNIRKYVVIQSNQILNLEVKGGLVVFNTTSLQEQCVVLFSCYGEGVGASRFISDNNQAFIVGDKNTTAESKLVVYREDSTNSCYLKNTWKIAIAISYQVVGGFF